MDREPRTEDPHSLVKKRIRFNTKPQEVWKIIEYDDEGDRFLVIPDYEQTNLLAPPEETYIESRHDGQWVKRENFEVI